MLISVGSVAQPLKYLCARSFAVVEALATVKLYTVVIYNACFSLPKIFFSIYFWFFGIEHRSKVCYHQQMCLLGATSVKRLMDNYFSCYFLCGVTIKQEVAKQNTKFLIFIQYCNCANDFFIVNWGYVRN